MLHFTAVGDPSAYQLSRGMRETSVKERRPSPTVPPFPGGVLVEDPDASLVQVSGTAAIDQHGQSLHLKHYTINSYTVSVYHAELQVIQLENDAESTKNVLTELGIWSYTDLYNNLLGSLKCFAEE